LSVLSPRGGLPPVQTEKNGIQEGEEEIINDALENCQKTNSSAACGQ